MHPPNARVPQMTDSIEIIKSVNHELKRCEELGVCSADSLPKSSETNSVTDILGNSQQYEVLFQGRLRLAQKRALPSFIDETVDAWKQQAKQTAGEEEQRTGGRNDRASIPILSIDGEAAGDQAGDQASDQTGDQTSDQAGDHRTAGDDENKENENKENSENSLECRDKERRKLNPLREENHGNAQTKRTSSSDALDQSTYQNKNHLHLPSSHSLITNTQSLDESMRESILSDLKEVNKQKRDKPADGEASPGSPGSPGEQKQRKANRHQLDAHLLTDNLDDLGEIRRSASAKSSSIGHASKMNKLQTRSGARLRSASGDTRMSKQVSLPAYGRPRTGSGGSSEFNRRYANSILQLRAKNRTMLFLIGRFEICLLSLDNQQILLKKSFNSVTHCSQGVNYPDHFGFICREESKNLPAVYPNYRQQLDGSNGYLNSNSSSSSCLDTIDADSKSSSTSNLASSKLISGGKLSSTDLSEPEHHYVGYIFRGENEKLANEIMYSLKQAFRNAHQAIQQSKTRSEVFCSECPLRCFNQLCIELQEVSVEKAQCVILTRIGELAPNEQKGKNSILLVVNSDSLPVEFSEVIVVTNLLVSFRNHGRLRRCAGELHSGAE